MYRLGVRHRDNSHDPATEWSNRGERLFRTVVAATVQPLILNDIVETPGPRWISAEGNNIILPAAAKPPVLRIKLKTGELLLAFRGFDGVTNLIRHQPPLATHGAMRMEMFAGDTGQTLVLPKSRLAFTDASGARHKVTCRLYAWNRSSARIFGLPPTGAHITAPLLKPSLISRAWHVAPRSPGQSYSQDTRSE